VTNCRKETVIDVVNCDHHQICKPESMQSPLFLSIVSHVELFLKSSGPASPGLKPTRTKSNEKPKVDPTTKPAEKPKPVGKAKPARKAKSKEEPKARRKEKKRPVEKVITVENVRPVISFKPPKPPKAPRNTLVKARPLPKPPKSQQPAPQSASVRSLPIWTPSAPPPPPPPPTRSYSAPRSKKSEPGKY